MNAEPYDVAIIGGGPAGSTAATLLAKAGRRVIVFEREKFPRFHIGESLLPASMRTFDRLGVQDKLRAHFLEKFGGEMASSCSDTSVRFYFEDGYGSQIDRSYQVTRADFDKVLLDHAAESGAEVCEETSVQNVVFTDDVALNVQYKNGTARHIRARYLIDASGRNSFVGAMFKLRKNYEQLHKFSLFAHYTGVERPEGRDGTLTRMIRGADRWFWMIPLTPERTSIGLVTDTSNFREAKQDPEKFFQEALAEQPNIAETMGDAQRVSQVYSATDFSYRNTKLVGDRWMLAGDAAGFIDPVFSSGVFLAIMSGEMCADALDHALTNPKRTRRLFARYARQFNYAMDVYVRFVNAWYKKEFIEVFLYPQDVLQIPPAVNAMLGGNVFSGLPVRWRMWVFYLLVFLQKYFPLCPRRTLLPRKKMEAVAAGEPAGAVF
jgi:geranylgeranyl reductase family protein